MRTSNDCLLVQLQKQRKEKGGKGKSSQDVIRVLCNGGSDAVGQASGPELA